MVNEFVNKYSQINNVTTFMKGFIYQKIIDRSTLREGFTIPVEYHPLLHGLPGGDILRGESRNIKILIDGEEYDAQLKNQIFDESKFVDHTDVIQIRYSVNSPISKKLREVFRASWEYVEAIKALPENVGRKFTIKVPQQQQEQMIITGKNFPDVFLAECVTLDDKATLGDEIGNLSESEYEQGDFVVKEDSNAYIGYGKTLRRIRHLDRSIGDSLKRLYDYRCQMTGERVGEEQEALCVEAHHIVPFTQSLNNNYSNIIILSPSYHRIVHKVNPEFNREELTFTFPNGLVEKVMLDKHLKVNN